MIAQAVQLERCWTVMRIITANGREMTDQRGFNAIRHEDVTMKFILTKERTAGPCVEHREIEGIWFTSWQTRKGPCPMVVGLFRVSHSQATRAAVRPDWDKVQKHDYAAQGDAEDRTGSRPG